MDSAQIEKWAAGTKFALAMGLWCLVANLGRLLPGRLGEWFARRLS